MIIEQEQAMFGCPRAELDTVLQEGINVTLLGKHDGALMEAMSWLSDAQESLERGRTEQARQWINCAKYFISTVMEHK